MLTLKGEMDSRFRGNDNFEVVWLNNRSALPEASWRVPLSQTCLKNRIPSCSQPDCLFCILHLERRRVGSG